MWLVSKGFGTTTLHGLIISICMALSGHEPNEPVYTMILPMSLMKFKFKTYRFAQSPCSCSSTQISIYILMDLLIWLSLTRNVVTVGVWQMASSAWQPRLLHTFTIKTGLIVSRLLLIIREPCYAHTFTSEGYSNVWQMTLFTRCPEHIHALFVLLNF